MLTPKRRLPSSIAGLLAGKPYTIDRTGLSGSEVLVFEDYVLKIGTNEKTDRETAAVLAFLKGRLPVPEVVEYTFEGGQSFFLMTRIRGKMACDPDCLSHADKTVSLLAEGLRMFWAVDPAGCPRRRLNADYLSLAEDRVAKHLVDMENTKGWYQKYVVGFLDKVDNAYARLLRESGSKTDLHSGC